METLVKILPADLVGKLHTGQSDSPELGTVGMQQLFDAHPKLIDEKFNSAVDAQNANNEITQAHIDSTDNPHGVTKEHVGLSKCDNTADADKPVSTAQRAAIKAVQSDVDSLKANVLTKDNTVPYTPTEDNHPATRKYVLDSINTSGNVTPEQTDYWNAKADKSITAPVMLTAAGWAEDTENGWWTQPVTHPAIKDGYKVDIMFDATNIKNLSQSGTSIVIRNNSGEATAYAFNSVPSTDITGQIEIYEVADANALIDPYVVGWEFNQSTHEIVYTDDAVNFAPAKMNFDTDTFDYGSWEYSWLIRDIKPCVLKNGVVQYYLDPNDFSKKLDGTDADIQSGADGDVMIEFPMCYYKLYQDGANVGCKFSLIPQDGTWCSNAFLNKQGISQNTMYMAAYDGFELDGKLRSLSRKAPTIKKTISAFRTLSTANGAGYQQQEWEKRSYIQALSIMMFKGLDSQSLLGKGATSASAKINTGTMNKKGMFWGDQTGTNGVKCFGIENLWGNIYKFCDGLMNTSGTYKYKIYAPYNDTASGYLSGGTIGGTSGKYINTMIASNGFGLLPSATTADEPASNYHDVLYYGTGDTYLCRAGGGWSGAAAGLFCLSLVITASASNSGMGASLSFTPQ